MRPEQSARDVASRIIAQQTPADHPANDLAPVAEALRLTVAELSRWVGSDGCQALLNRALNRALQSHPALSDVQVVSKSAPVLVGIEQSIESNGATAVAAGLTTTLVRLFELLERVIGEDLIAKLAEQIIPGDTAGAAQLELKQERKDPNV